MLIVAVSGLEPPTISTIAVLYLTELHDTHFVYTPTSPSQTGIIAALFAGVIDK